MAIQGSFNLSNALSSQAYAYKCWYNYNYGNNTMGISAQDMGEITQTWNGELANWQATAMDDENAYEIEDDDFSTAKDNGRAQAQDAAGGYDGKQGGQVTRTIADVAMGAAGALATTVGSKVAGNIGAKVGGKLVAKAGEKVNFVAPEAIYTQEGTLLIPANSKVVATIIKIEKPKWFNKNARVYLNFECIVFPDGSAMAMSAKPFTKDGSLKEGPWMTAAKIAGSTVGLGAVGAGAGVGFAFIPNPAKLGTGFAIGIPVGCTVGLITGLVTPGLKPARWLF